MESNEFMLNLVKKLMDERKVAETTANAYVKSLYALNGKKPFKSLTFLKKTDEIDKILETYAETTQRALLATLSSVLSLYKETNGYKKPYSHYFNSMMGKSKALREAAVVSGGEMTPKQKENWLSWSEVMERKGELAASVALMKKTLTPTQYATLLQYVVLSLYTDIQPRRNQDFLGMYIVKKLTDKHTPDKNYYDVERQKFVFHKFKTVKTYGAQTLEVPEELQKVLGVYLRHHPLWKGVAKRKTDPVKLLVENDGTPLTAVNAITRILNRIFGRKLGSSMLRHIYISEKFGGALDEQKAAADAMAHSVGLQREYYKKPPTTEAPELKNEVVLDSPT